jgi:Flp pilus assembly protein TadB
MGGDGLTTKPERTAAQRERRFWLWLGGCLLLVGIVEVLVLPAILGYSLASPLTLLLLLVYVVVVALAVGLAVLLRRSKLRMFQRSVLWEVDRPDRKVVLRAIRRGDRVPDRLTDLALRTAAQIAGRRGLAWIGVVLLLIDVGNGFLQHGLTRWFWFVLGALYLCVVGYWLWFQRRAQAFLARS